MKTWGFENVRRFARLGVRIRVWTGARIESRSGSRLLAVCGAVWLWLMLEGPRIAHACSVCTAGRDEQNQTAFLLSTVFMSVLPLLSLGTLVWVLWRRFRKLEEETRRRSAASLSPMPPSAGA